MTFKFEIKGLNELQRKLNRLQSKARSLDGTHRVPVRQLLTPSFIRKHTRCSSVDEWFDQSPFKIESPEDFEAIPDAEWDAYVRRTTSFPNWEQMLKAAGADYLGTRLLS